MAYSKPWIAWNDLIKDATVTASTEDTANGNLATNVQDMRRTTHWTGTGSSEQTLTANFGGNRTFDTCIIMAGDLHTQGATVYLEKYAGGAWTEIDHIAPADDKIIVFTFAAVTDSQVRLRIPVGYTLPPSIGIWHVSSRLTFPRFIQGSFDPDAHTVNMETSVSRAGELLAMTRASIMRNVKATFNKVPAAWVDSYFSPFWVGCVACLSPRPWFFSWEPGGHATAVIYAWLSEPKWDIPYDDITRTINLDMTGLWEE